MFPARSEEDRYFNLTDLAAYSGLSTKTLRRHLAAVVKPLPHFRVGGRLLVRKSDFDRWVLEVGRHRDPTKNPAVDQRLVQSITKSIRGEE